MESNVNVFIQLDNAFSNHKDFHIYVVCYTNTKVVKEGWCLVNILLSFGGDNNTCYIRFPRAFMLSTYRATGGSVNCLIPFQQTIASSTWINSSPWVGQLYEEYTGSVSCGHLVLVDFFVDGATLSKSGTQSGTLLRIRFSNIWKFSEKWFDIGI